MHPIVLLVAITLAAPAPSSPGPTVAVEDTLHVDEPEVLVRAPRVTLDEILDRVARGEAQRDQLIQDVVFTATLRVVRCAQGEDSARVIQESVNRVYKRKPDRVRAVELRSREDKPSRMGRADVNFSASTGEIAVNFAFRPEARRDYRYRILGRDLFGDHLVYRIAFEPRSLVGATEPSGVVWVDTRDFVIVRQELEFPRSPVPLLIKGMRRMVVERQLADGHWVLRRMLLRAETTMPMPRVGRAFDMAIQFDDYRINRGIDDAVFGAAVKP